MSYKQANMMRNKQAGFLGLEGMGSLLFYLVMLAGVAFLIAQLFSSSKLMKVEQGLTIMRMGIQQLYSRQGNYGSYNSNEWEKMTQTVLDAGIRPSDFEYTTFISSFGSKQTGIKTPWNTSIRIFPWDNCRKFAIKVYVPPNDCVKLATYGLTGWDGVEVGYGNKSTPIYSIEEVPSLCKQDDNTLIVLIAK